jgi:hypothetical protein
VSSIQKPGNPGADAAGGETGHALARLGEEPPRCHGNRKITRELAKQFAKVLLSDHSHTVESASNEVGLRANTVREAISRHDKSKCRTLEDEEICAILADAKTRHIHALRKYGFGSAGKGNGPGANWVKWQLEVQDPLHHPRPRNDVTLSGPNGGPIQHATLKEATVEELQAILHETEPQE